MSTATPEPPEWRLLVAIMERLSFDFERQKAALRELGFAAGEEDLDVLARDSGYALEILESPPLQDLLSPVAADLVRRVSRLVDDMPAPEFFSGRGGNWDKIRSSAADAYRELVTPHP